MIFHNRPTIGREEISAISKVINSKHIAQGKEVKKFENAFAEYYNLKSNNVVAVNNGTSALYLALWALNAKQKKVYYPNYSCSSLRNATSLIGGNERLLDVKFKSPLTKEYNFRKNSIVINPHMYGFPSVIKKKSIQVIEDSCQSLGIKHNNQPFLSGKITIFSFYATKMMTTAGQGGMIVSKNTSLINEIIDYLNFDYRRDNKIRFNFQMTDVQASMGIVQLKKLNKFIAKRKEIFDFYKNLKLPMLDLKNNENFEPVRYRSIILNKNPNKIIKEFKKFNIQTINPLQPWELLSKSKKYKNSIDLSSQTISLPCYPSLKKKELIQIEQVIDRVSSLL